MTAPVPTTLEELLHAVVEACVEEIAAARHEVAIVRTATAAERRDLEEMLATERQAVRAAEAMLAEREGDLEALRLELARTKGALDAARGELVDAEDLRPRKPRTPRAPTAERSADAATQTPSPRSPAVEVGKAAVQAPSGAGTATAAQPTAVGASATRTGRPPVDLTGVKVGSFVCIEKTRGRGAGGAIVWLFRCEHCGAERGWTNSHVQTTKRARIPGRCVCQGGPKVVKAPILKHVAYKPQTDGTKADEELEDLSQLDDLDADGLLSRAMAEAEGDGLIRSLAARASRPKAEREREEDLEDNDGEPRAVRDPEDEDSDEDTTEELDFE